MQLKLVVLDLQLSRRQRIAASLALAIGVGFVATAGQADIVVWQPGDPLTAEDLNQSFAEVKIGLVPPGVIVPYAGEAVPEGWLLCDGSAVSRTDNMALFDAIGVTYGVGDAVATFNLPDLRGRVVLGAGLGPGLTEREPGDVGGGESVTLSVGNLPSHAHSITDVPHTHAATQAAHTHTNSVGQSFITAGQSTYQLQLGSNYGMGPATLNSQTPAISVNAANTGITGTQSTGGGQPFSKLPPYGVSSYIIKR